jgi:hypothetical protein
MRQSRDLALEALGRKHNAEMDRILGLSTEADAISSLVSAHLNESEALTRTLFSIHLNNESFRL